MDLPAGMLYARYAPRAALADTIEHFWIIDAEVGPAPRREILVPNGRPVILVSLGDTGERIDPETDATTPNASAIAGIATRPLILSQTGRSRLVAAQPTPFGLSALGAPLSIDTTLPLGDWLGPDEAEALVAALTRQPPGEAAARHLEDALTARLSPLAPETRARLNAAVALIEDAGGDVQIAGLSADLGCSYDQLYRDFRRHVGIAPKTFIAIVRYQNLVGRLLAGAMGDGLAQLALMQGYYDQAHANRDFRRFTGMTPTRFRKTLNGIAKMMHGM